MKPTERINQSLTNYHVILEIMQNKPLTRPLQGCKDMDKDKDKDKVMDKDKDKEVVNIEIILPFQTEKL